MGAKRRARLQPCREKERGITKERERDKSCKGRAEN